MSSISTNGGEFIERAKTIILDNVSNEQFGVSELAEIMNMSRSSLLRKIKSHTQLSASKFIRQIRLQKGMEMRLQTSLTVSEISYQVGFGSTSYFIKCFREYYGYPPGEVGKVKLDAESVQKPFQEQHRSKIIIGALLLALIVLVFLFKGMFANSKIEVKIEKTIAVLPFNNESNDSTNLYFVNGLMESTLNNLQKIEELRVISRTSVEQYRNTNKSIPEIAKDLNVNYLVEGSGQRVGNFVLLNIQLIEASSDTPIWVEQYRHKVLDIFTLQVEIAKNIADAIEAIVTPAELEQIDKKPTENILAYDYYLQALDPYYSRTKEGLEKAINLFEEAIKHDPKFALAYADIAISYYFLDLDQTEKQYTELINNYADKALLHNSKNSRSLIAKALYYMHIKEFRLALPHLEKALEYNPNSADVVQLLSALYAFNIPNSSKYLKYALKGIQLDIAANDSISKSYIYLSLSNALIQTGFTDEALSNINLSLSYNPQNHFAPYVKTLIQFAKDRDLKQTTKSLIQEWQNDTTRLDILQDVAKFYYYQEDYDSAFYYYYKFVNIRETSGLDIYRSEDLKIGIVYEKMGMDKEAAFFYNSYSQYCKEDQSIYKSASMSMKFAHGGDINQAIEQLKTFATQDNIQYWILVFIEIDPTIKVLKTHPDYDGIIQKIEDRFWKNQTKLKKSLEEAWLI